MERTYPRSRQKWLSWDGAQDLRPWLLALFLGSAALGAWFLIGPAVAHGRYYRVGFNRSTYEYTRPLLLLFVPYGLALLAWVRGSRVPLWVLLVSAVVLTAEFRRRPGGTAGDTAVGAASRVSRFE